MLPAPVPEAAGETELVLPQREPAGESEIVLPQSVADSASKSEVVLLQPEPIPPAGPTGGTSGNVPVMPPQPPKPQRRPEPGTIAWDWAKTIVPCPR